MYTSFDRLPDHSRIWLYVSSTPWNVSQDTEIKQQIEQFLTQWATHGKSLQASMKTICHQILVIGLNESSQLPSGCSIDSSVQFIQELGKKLNINFFGRDILLETSDGFKPYELVEFKAMLKTGSLDLNTKILDTTIQNKSQLSGLLKPLKESWAARFLPQNV